MTPGVVHEPGNRALGQLLESICPDMVAARKEAAAKEHVAVLGDKDVPLFVCTLAYPSMSTFLHIFEPRYRLMIRRAVENGTRRFGMMMYNRRGQPQGDLGPTQFMQYGTMLHINNVEMLPDGRSLIETRGLFRFRVKDWHTLDGYLVGDVERVDDISLAEEEEVETAETGGPSPPPNNILAQLDHMPTADLMRIGPEFITRMRAASAPWLHERILASHGQLPQDPALFPYWFACILPIDDEEKYKLLLTTSVRQRVKLTARWVRGIEAQRW